MVPLEDPPGATLDSRGHGISADGSVIVGADRTQLNEAFRWTQSEGMVGIGFLDGKDTSSANAISADGTVIVGRSSVNGAPVEVEALRWTDSDGMVGLGDLPGGDFFSGASGVSDDGSVIVGSAKSGPEFEAFRWTEADDMVGLGTIVDGNFFSLAFDVSADGAAISGYGSVPGGDHQAFRWTEGEGMVGLDRLPGASLDRGLGISADGAMVVGQTAGKAVIWNALNDVRSIADILIDDFAPDLTGWELLQAWDISDDLTTIVGVGSNPDGHEEAWIAQLDIPFSQVSFPPTPDEGTGVPEPTTLALMALGLAGLGFSKRSREA